MKFITEYKEFKEDYVIDTDIIKDVLIDFVDEYDAELDGVFLKGTSPGKLIGRADFATVDKIPDWIFE